MNDVFTWLDKYITNGSISHKITPLIHYHDVINIHHS